MIIIINIIIVKLKIRKSPTRQHLGKKWLGPVAEKRVRQPVFSITLLQTQNKTKSKQVRSCMIVSDLAGRIATTVVLPPPHSLKLCLINTRVWVQITVLK